MRRERIIGFLGGCCIVGLSTAWLAQAGDLDPPTGPIQPTMRSLDEIYEAVQTSGSGSTASDSTWNQNAAESRLCGAAQIAGIPGDDLVFDTEQAVRVIGLEHGVYIDPGSGHRVHDMLLVTKNIDRTTPMLYQALVMAQTIDQIDLWLYREHPGSGEPEAYYRVRLTNARVQHVGTKMLLKSDGAFAHVEQVGFIYQRIRWTYLPEGIEFEDDLMQP